MIPRLVAIRGAGDLASGVAHRLYMAGFKIVMLELPQPLVVRRTVSFATAVYTKSYTVEEVEAVLYSAADITAETVSDKIAIVIDPEGSTISKLKPSILIDATMTKTGLLTNIDDAELVIGLGPGFKAGVNAHTVIETMRGPDLGLVINNGQASINTGVPGEISGYDIDRVLRSPVDGVFQPVQEIGAVISKGEIIAYIDGMPLKSSIDGLLRGLLYPGLTVNEGMKVGDIDPRGKSINYYRISDKARAIGGAVLEAIMNRYFFDNN